MLARDCSQRGDGEQQPEMLLGQCGGSMAVDLDPGRANRAAERHRRRDRSLSSGRFDDQRDALVARAAENLGVNGQFPTCGAVAGPG